MRARVCTISGPGLLSKSERERRGREIVTKAGADTFEYFNKVVQQRKVGLQRSGSKRITGWNVCETVNGNLWPPARSKIGSAL